MKITETDGALHIEFAPTELHLTSRADATALLSEFAPMLGRRIVETWRAPGDERASTPAELKDAAADLRRMARGMNSKAKRLAAGVA